MSKDILTEFEGRGDGVHILPLLFSEYYAFKQGDRGEANVCGIKVQDIQDPLMQKIRYLDKLIDELAKGKAIEKIMR